MECREKELRLLFLFLERPWRAQGRYLQPAFLRPSRGHRSPRVQAIIDLALSVAQPIQPSIRTIVPTFGKLSARMPSHMSLVLGLASRERGPRAPTSGNSSMPRVYSSVKPSGSEKY